MYPDTEDHRALVDTGLVPADDASDGFPLPCAKLNAAGRITWDNRAARALWGTGARGLPVWTWVELARQEPLRQWLLDPLGFEEGASFRVRLDGLPKDHDPLEADIYAQELTSDPVGLRQVVLVEVTAQAGTLRQLREENTRLRGLFCHSADAISILSLQSDGQTFLIHDLNPAAERLWGNSRWSLLGRSPQEVLTAARAEQLVTRYACCVAAASPVSFEESVLSDGEMRLFETRLFPIGDDSGQIRSVAGVSRDVTERVATEEEARRRSDQLRAVLEGSQDGAWDWDVAGDTISRSPRWAHMLQYEPNQVPTTVDAWSSLIHPEDRDRVMRELELHLRDEKPEYCSEYRLRTQTGSWRWVADRGRVVSRSAEGRPMRVAGTLSDIQARHDAEQALRDSEQRYRSVVSVMAEGIVLQTSDGQIVACNQAAQRILELTEDQLLGLDAQHPGWQTIRPDGDPCPPDEHPATVTLRTGQPCLDVTIGLRRQDGRITWLRINAQPLIRPAEDQPYGVVTSFTDITSTVTAMRELRQAREIAERATAAKTEFLAMMSHEIRTPMNGVLGMCDLLLRSGLSDEQRVLGQYINESATALLGIINDILDISKIESGHVDLLHEPFDLGALLQSAARVVGPTCDQKGLRLQVSTEPSMPAVFRGDPGRLRQILVNLLGNAAKFTTVGSVTLAAGYDFIEAGVRFRVIDTGPGIPAEERSRLFNKFTQLVQASHNRSGGTGLGLAISRLLVERMGGRIDVISEVGQGTTFTVFVPLEIAPTSAKPAVPDQPGLKSHEGFAGRHILLVEDNTINQLVARKMLMKLGCQVTVASNGVEAIDQVRRNPRFAAILMDCHMPHLDGFEATRYIRQHANQDAHIPVIALTAAAEPANEVQCREAGMDDVLVKPIHLDSLAATLQRWLT